MITTKLYHSLIPVKPMGCEGDELRNYSLCQNEPFSFQMAYTITDGSAESIPFLIKVKTNLPINAYYVGCVPVIHADFAGIEPKQPIGMYPDILVPKKVNAELVKKEAWGEYMYFEANENLLLFAYNDSWQSIWFTVNEDGAEIAKGKYDIRIELYNRKLELVGNNCLSLDVIGEKLPAQSLIYTNWFHYDCLCDYYKVQLFSEHFFEIMCDFVRKAVRNGMNMLLLPAFTPPLDTAVGMERMTVQLVKVKVDKGKYLFDFTLLKKFVDRCREDGIQYFEHSHFFTQWGAEHAPKVMAEVDGRQERIFGWDTDACSAEYIGFLRAYLKELQKFLKEEQLENNILFHISDEPNHRNYENYERAYGKLADLLEGYMVGDALSDPKFHKSGLVKIPIASTRTVKEFVQKGGDIWCYYTGAVVEEGMSNRLILISRERNRMLGIQMYYYDIKGFLHWAYNYYYGELSSGLFHPAMNPCGGYPNAGTNYNVYPADDGTAYQSVRQKIFAEGIIDMRALQLLEKLAGRSVCVEIIEKFFGIPEFNKSPADPDTMIAFRRAVNEAIGNHSK